jgi:hypothetical protein
MVVQNFNTHKLQKIVWAEEDFDQMDWHDSAIHGISFLADSWELVFDIDYLLEWVSEEAVGSTVDFWVAPATLVFEGVNGLKTNFEIWTGSPLTPSIMNISRSNQRESNLAGNPWKWTIQFERGQMEFHATGFKQFIRANPVFQGDQSIPLEKRGGVSFERPTKI